MRYTIHPSVPDLRDHLYTAPPLYRDAAHEGLGITVPFRNQGQEGVCGGMSSTSAFAALWMLAGNPYMEFSPSFSYWWARGYEGTDDQDSGTTIQDELKGLVQYGACPASVMPYTPGDYRNAPTQAAITAAAPYCAAEYWRIQHDANTIRNIKSAFHDKLGIVIGIAVYDSFEAANSQGRIPMPDAAKEKMLGGHALYVHDIQDDVSMEGGGALIGDGSWDNTAPFYLPYAYVTDSRLAFELRPFTLTKAA